LSRGTDPQHQYITAAMRKARNFVPFSILRN
jgi:hypothetical protein